MRARDFVTEIGRRDILKGLAGAAGAAALGSVTSGAQAGEFVNYDKLIKDPELETVRVPRMQKLQQRCNSMLARLMRTAGSAWAQQLAGTSIRVESNDQHIQADPEGRSISIDLTVFWDAPEDVLAFAIGHELGHVALGHVGVPNSPEESRRDESNADQFGVRLCKALGYNKAGVFKFLYGKQGEIEKLNRQTSQPNSTHPSVTQRMDRARQQGFQLSRGGVQQMHTLMTHLA
jgi:predicted Zn-dependent protease